MKEVIEVTLSSSEPDQNTQSPTYVKTSRPSRSSRLVGRNYVGEEENMKINSKAPWLNEEGNPLSTEELTAVSRNWSPIVWEKYLTSTETYRRETLLEDPEMEAHLSVEDHRERYVEMMEKPDLPQLSESMTVAMRYLPKVQSEIIRLTFWEDMSLAKIADRLGMTKSAVHRQKNSALRKLADLVIRVTVKNTLTKMNEVSK